MFLLEHISHHFLVFLLLTLIKQMLQDRTLSIYKRWNYSSAEVFLGISRKFQEHIFCKTFWTAASRSASSDHRELLSPFWNFSVFWIMDHGKCLVCEFGIRIPGKIAGKVNAWKEKVWSFTKNNFVRRNFSSNSYVHIAHPELYLKQQV